MNGQAYALLGFFARCEELTELDRTDDTDQP